MQRKPTLPEEMERTGLAAVVAPDASDELLHISGLKTHFQTDDGTVRAVDGVDLSIPAGKTVCVVGESGCGKSVTGRSILQLIDPPGRIVSGEIAWRTAVDAEWTSLTSLDPRGGQMSRIRGGQISMIFQEPIASLSPMYTVGDRLAETIRLHLTMSKQEAYEHAVGLLRRVGIPQPEQRMNAYPFQLSGGMCQRVMIANALSCGPRLLIADEPTTALDVTTQARIIELLTGLRDETGMAMMFITHDLGVVAEIADEVAVMYLGTVVEQGSVNDIFHRPKHPYTQALLRSIPTMGSGKRRRRQPLQAIRGMVPHPLQRPEGCPFHTRCQHAIPGVCDVAEPPLISFEGGQAARCHLYGTDGELVSDADTAEPDRAVTSGAPVAGEARADSDRRVGADSRRALLEVHDLTMHFPIRRGFLSRTVGHVRAIDGIDLTIHDGETLGLVGESGCGKTTLGQCIARAITPSSGSIEYRENDHSVDLAALSTRELHRFRQAIRVIFQDPFSTLNPRMTLLQIVGEPLKTSHLASGTEMRDRVADMLTKVGLRPEYLNRYPHAFSGGERQRINIARALITNPRLVIADEAVSALDVSVRAQILNLLADLQEELGLTYLFISHDLSVVEHLCDRVAVMYLGKIVETANTADLYRRPQHPYTEALLNAVPIPDPDERRANHHRMPDELPDPSNPPSGCRFHTRCPYAQSNPCTQAEPELRVRAGTHAASCHFADELELAGVRRAEPVS